MLLEMVTPPGFAMHHSTCSTRARLKLLEAAPGGRTAVMLLV